MQVFEKSHKEPFEGTPECAILDPNPSFSN